ncbi:hypothetical protein [Nocardioides sp. SYSU D00065]|uniref:hypothetical protein n=1 Tax=Nocardioides sp. SYSU D00065 TaxID=2817378 RepID=UPI001B3216B4|nr:hypothetical protein [Nocardioides sp. SYSU D00065]
MLLFAMGTVARGWEYVSAEPERTMSRVVEQGLSHAQLSPHAWGMVLIVTGLLVLTAYAVRIHVLVFFAHGLAAIVYLTVTVGFSQAATDLGAGWAHAAPTLLATLWHALVAKLTGPLPTRTRSVSEGAPGAASR